MKNRVIAELVAFSRGCTPALKILLGYIESGQEERALKTRGV